MEDRRALDWIFARRSIRRFTSEPVTEEQIELLLQAAMAAPSASDRKPWHFVVVQERSTLDRIAALHPYAEMCREAPLAIAVCAELEFDPRYWVQDCSAATENLLLAATALGLGAVWLGVHPRPEREEPLKELLGVPAGHEMLAIVALGHGREHKPPRTQYDPALVHRESW